MDKRKYNYNIQINFNSNSNNLIFDGKIDYLGSIKYKDNLTIRDNLIIMECNRISKLNLENIFNNHNGSLYIQIIKSLAYYYSIKKIFIRINSISIAIKNKDIADTKKINNRKLSQIVEKNFQINNSFLQNNIQMIFKETPKGRSCLIAITHILKAGSLKDESEKFERLWKGFNPLYRFIGNYANEHECLKSMRQFILDNAKYFTKSNSLLNQIDGNSLRNSIRWRALILNNFNIEKKTKSFRDFILRYSDYRIMQAFKETLVYRETFLKKHGYYNKVIKHINDHIAANTTHNIEILAFLSCKYMYFVRNKSFHGEKIDSTFRLTSNNEIKEIKWLNNILESLLTDLINCNGHY